jgi:hypothetical protein
MTTKSNAASPAATTPQADAPPARTRTRSRIAGAVVLGATLAAAGVLAGAGHASPASASVLTNCAAKPSACGYPDATNSGVPSGTTLKTVPSQISSGPGWSYNAAAGDVAVTGNGAVLSGLYIPYNLEIDANNVTIKNVQVVTSGNFGISLRHTTGVTIENSTISGQNATTGRVGSAIDDIYGDSTGITITDTNIYSFKTGIQVQTGTITGNYLHDPGYVAGDHTNGFFVNGGTEPMTIKDNTVFDSLNQTDAISLDASAAGTPVANKTIENNFLAGGSYTIYGGDSLSNTISKILIENNRFGQLYYTTSGQYGPVAYFTATGTGGNVWSGNVYDTTGATIPSM